jgi:hypothetical protein
LVVDDVLLFNADVNPESFALLSGVNTGSAEIIFPNTSSSSSSSSNDLDVEAVAGVDGENAVLEDDAGDDDANDEAMFADRALDRVNPCDALPLPFVIDALSGVAGGDIRLLVRGLDEGVPGSVSALAIDWPISENINDARFWLFDSLCI